MTLLATQVTIQGRRVWLEGATTADVEYVNYRVGLKGLLVQKDEKLPRVEKIEYEQKAQDKP